MGKQEVEESHSIPLYCLQELDSSWSKQQTDYSRGRPLNKPLGPRLQHALPLLLALLSMTICADIPVAVLSGHTSSSGAVPVKPNPNRVCGHGLRTDLLNEWFIWLRLRLSRSKSNESSTPVHLVVDWFGIPTDLYNAARSTKQKTLAASVSPKKAVHTYNLMTACRCPCFHASPPP